MTYLTGRSISLSAHSGDVRFYIGGVSASNERLRVTAVGNVGIGTTVPIAKLAVVGAGTTTARAFEIDDNLYNPKVVVLDNGNVGIGTILPVAALAVGVGQPNAMTITGADAYIKGNLEVDGKIYGDGSQLTSLPGAVSGLTLYSVPRASNATTLIDSGIYATASGAVGIGTTDPGIRKLVVTGDIEAVSAGIYAVTGTFDTWTTYSGIGLSIQPYYTGQNATTSGVNINLAPNDATGGTNYALQLNPTYSLGGTSSDVDFFINRVETTLGSGSHYIMRLQQNSNDRFVITNTGNVGIGTVLPAAALAVGVGQPNAMSITGSDAYIKGNLEVDGRIYGDGSRLMGVPGAVSGLTANRVPVANSSTTLIDSGIYYVGGNVGIGGASPLGALDITKDVGLYSMVHIGRAANVGGYITSVADSQFSFAGGSEYVNGNWIARATTAASINNNSGRIDLRTNGSLTIGNTFVPTDRLTVTIAGNAGIGTSAPAAKLHIGDNNSAPNVMSITGSDLYAAGNIEFDGRIYGDGSRLTGVSGAVSGLTANRVPVANSSTTLVDSLIYQVSGNVGIGSTSPDSLVNLIGATAGDGATDTGYGSILHIKQKSVWTVNQEWALFVEGYTYLGGFRINAADGLRSLFKVGSGGTLGFATESLTTPIKFTQGNIYERMTIAVGGNIGIGTTAPLAKLVVAGVGTTTARAFEIDDNLYNPKVVILDNGNVGIGTTAPTQTLNVLGTFAIRDATADRITFEFNKGSDGIARMLTVASNGWSLEADHSSAPPIVFKTGTGAGAAEKVRIDNRGNLGIGTTAPTSKLEVVGDFGSAIVAKGNSTGAVTIDWSAGGTQHITLTGNVTLTFSNGVSGHKYTLIVKQDGTGGRTVTWPGTVRWSGASAPTVTTTASKSDYIGFVYNSVDSTYDGIGISQNY